jgi:hypothetical protein
MDLEHVLGKVETNRRGTHGVAPFVVALDARQLRISPMSGKRAPSTPINFVGVDDFVGVDGPDGIRCAFDRRKSRCTVDQSGSGRWSDGTSGGGGNNNASRPASSSASGNGHVKPARRARLR